MDVEVFGAVESISERVYLKLFLSEGGICVSSP